MPEPTSTTVAVATLAASGLTLPMLTLFGVPLGLRADVLIAGLLGSLVGIILLNTVPGDTDTWLHLMRTTVRRMMVAMASAITAGYLTPLVLLLSNVPDSLLLSCACAVGGGAQQVLNFVIRRLAPPPGSTGLEAKP
ncbi:MAG: hypothetical protein A3I66_00600 [Burkholderiales bacterium RIFCSPLOWO2_02_FULL_57_36]|nr:MAG: hypothetical protein A3I66_00600 [Burkholderiales bacterium RIFCSPLOWO2_02_FULL_57_36]